MAINSTRAGLFGPVLTALQTGFSYSFSLISSASMTYQKSAEKSFDNLKKTADRLFNSEYSPNPTFKVVSNNRMTGNVYDIGYEADCTIYVNTSDLTTEQQLEFARLLKPLVGLEPVIISESINFKVGESEVEAIMSSFGNGIKNAVQGQEAAFTAKNCTANLEKNADSIREVIAEIHRVRGIEPYKVNSKSTTQDFSAVRSAASIIVDRTLGFSHKAAADSVATLESEFSRLNIMATEEKLGVSLGKRSMGTGVDIVFQAEGLNSDQVKDYAKKIEAATGIKPYIEFAYDKNPAEIRITPYYHTCDNDRSFNNMSQTARHVTELRRESEFVDKLSAHLKAHGNDLKTAVKEANQERDRNQSPVTREDVARMEELVENKGLNVAARSTSTGLGA